jgi:glycosyltransferase involved in cell wall biosynthesis
MAKSSLKNKPMNNLLIIAHSYLHPQWQNKLFHLAASFSSVVLIQPAAHMSNDLMYQFQQDKNNCPENLTFVHLKAFFIKSPTFYTYYNIPLFVWRFIRAKPTCILLEEDPYSSVGILTLLCVYFLKKFKPNLKLCLFTWDNLNRVPTNPLKRFLKTLAVSFSRRLTDGIICGNEDAALIAREQKQYLCPRVVLPYIGVPLKAKKSRNFPYQRPISIGYIGRMVPEKGLMTLLEGFKLIQTSKQMSLVLVGSGPLLEHLKVICNTNSIPATFPGWVTFEKVNHYLSFIDVLVLPSLTTPTWREQFGLVLSQAMLMGIPCVGSSSGAIPQVINNPNLIFQEGNKDELAYKLSLLINNPDLYEAASLFALSWSASCLDDASVGINYTTFLKYLSSKDSSNIFQEFPYSQIQVCALDPCLDCAT